MQPETIKLFLGWSTVTLEWVFPALEKLIPVYFSLLGDCGNLLIVNQNQVMEKQSTLDKGQRNLGHFINPNEEQDSHLFSPL